MLNPCRFSYSISCTSFPNNHGTSCLRMMPSSALVRSGGIFIWHYGDFCTGADSINIHSPGGTFGAGANPRGLRIKWFENSATATHAHRAFCIDLAWEVSGLLGRHLGHHQFRRADRLSDVGRAAAHRPPGRISCPLCRGGLPDVYTGPLSRRATHHEDPFRRPHL